MQKLVLKNPILRFKYGKKILKGLWGLQTRKDRVVVNRAGVPVYTTNGGYTPPTMTQDATYLRQYPHDKQILPGLYLEYGTNDVYASRPEDESGYARYKLISEGNVPPVNGTYYETKDTSGKVIERGRYFGGVKHSLPIGKNSNKSKSQKQQSSKELSATIVKPKTVAKQPSNYYFGKVGGWNKSMKNNITDEESLRMLKEMGMENYSAGLVLDEINKWFGLNAVKRDDRWGNLSRAGLKNLYENWKLLNNNSSINLPSKILNSIAVNLEPITPEQQTELSIINNNFPVIENEGGLKYFSRNGNYNRSLVRDYMRSMGLNPYNFTGGLRRALRRFLNNEGKGGEYIGKQLYDLFVKPYGYKQGGQLVSRDPITRFKNKIK